MSLLARVFALWVVVAAIAIPAPAAADTVETLWSVDDGACAAEAGAVDAGSILYVACHSLYDREWRITAYDAGGALIAVRTYNGLAGEPTPVGAFVDPSAVALDEAAGRLYVVGSAVFAGDDTERGVVVALSIPDLAIEWERPLPDLRLVADAALAADGGLVVDGQHHNGTDGDLVVARLDAAGVPQWSYRYDSGGEDGPSSAWDTLAVDGSGNAYAIGVDTIVKVSSSGALEWVVERPALALALQDDRYLAVTTPLVPHGQTALLDLDGELLWEVDVGGHFLATADHGDVWAARTDYPGPYDWNWEVFRIGDSGDVRWSYTLGDTRQDSAADIAIDDADNAYVTGGTSVRGGFLNLFWVGRATTIKLGPDGDRRWRIDAAATSSPRSVLLSGDRVYMLGLTAHSAYRQTVEEPPACEWWQLWCWWR